MFAITDKIIGQIPYSITIKPGLKLTRENRYRPSGNSLYVDLQVISLDKVWQTTFRRGWSWNDFRTTLTSKANTHFNLHWTPTRGWWIQGSQTGWRTRPMPKFMGALLCGTLIVTFPKMLDLTFSHAENIENPTIAYSLLAGTILLICSLIGWYLWLTHKAKPSSLPEALRDFLKRIGRDEENDPVKPRDEEENISKKIDAPSKNLGNSNR